jgi:hypothetical protein
MHFDICTNFSANNNINADAKGARTTQKFGNDDGAIHKGDETIERQFGPSRGTLSFQTLKFIIYHLLHL